MITIPEGGPLAQRAANPINPRMLLLHHLLNSFQPQNPVGGQPHGFGPGGAVTGGQQAPADLIAHLAQMFQGQQNPGNLAQIYGAGQSIGDSSNPLQNMPTPLIQPPNGGSIDTGYNPAQYRRSQGQDQQAAADWEAHHPDAIGRGQIPDWVQQYMTNRLGQAHIGQVSDAHAQAHQLAQRITQMRGRRARQSLRRAAQPPMQAPPPTYS